MPPATLDDVVHYLRLTSAPNLGAQLADGDLLERFVVHRDQAAFTVLVRRHGPMVLGVCRRVLGDAHLAEDSFQATFLVLIRRAGTLGKRKPLGGWLYGVAQRVATKARAQANARREREMMDTTAQTPAIDDTTWQELRGVLDEEIARLPEKYRTPIVLCYFQGMSHEKAAKELGLPKRTLTSRVERGRDLLRQRLVGRGVTLSAGLLAATLGEKVLGHSVGAMLTINTTKAAIILAAGNAVVASSISVQAIALAEQVTAEIVAMKTKLLVILMIVGLAFGGAGITGYGAWTNQWRSDGSPTSPAPKVPMLTSKQVGNQVAPAAAGQAGPPLGQIEHKSTVLSMAWSPDGKWIATGTADGVVHVTDVTTGKKTKTFPTGTGPVVALTIAPDGKTAALSQDGISVEFWTIETGQMSDRHYFGQDAIQAPAKHLAFKRDGQTVIGVGVGAVYCAKADGATRISQVQTRPNPAAVAAVAPDGLVSGWLRGNGSLDLFHDNPPIARSMLQGAGRARCLAFGPNAKLLALGGEEKDVLLWDLVLAPMEVTQFNGKTGAITKAKMKDMNVVMRREGDLNLGKPLAKLTGLDAPATRLEFSADGTSLVALAHDGMSIRVWDLSNYSTRSWINHNRGPVGAMSLSPDGKMIATIVKDGMVLFLWRAATWELNNQRPPPKLDTKELAELWNDLASADYQTPIKAWRQLGAAGDQVIPMLREQIRLIAIPAADIKQIDKLLLDLNSDKYATRDNAIKGLTAVGEMAVVPLQRLLENPPSAEARERAKLLLIKVGEPALTPERVRVLDAIELLERLKTDAAIGLIQEIERDALVPQIRTGAQRALKRMKG